MARSRWLRCRQGNALVLSMLILLSMTAVGLVSVHRTNTDLLVAGNMSRMSQAGAAADAGLFETLAMVGWQPAGYHKALSAQRNLARMPGLNFSMPPSDVLAPTCALLDADEDGELDSGSYGFNLSVACRSTHQPNPETDGKARYLPVLDLAGAEGLQAQAAAFEVLGEYISESPSVMGGNSTEQSICYQTWDFSSRGGVPTREADVLTSLCPREDAYCRADSVVVEHRSRARSGPVQCSIRY